MLNSIGIDVDKAKELSDQLGELLANYSIFYQNVRGYHWNIKGKKFFELHVKFEELYNDLLLKIDEIAERILTLGFEPGHRYSDYVGVSEIKETDLVSDGDKAVEEILSAFKTLIVKQRALMESSSEARDEGTNSLMSDYTREQEKLVWMYRSFLSS